MLDKNRVNSNLELQGLLYLSIKQTLQLIGLTIDIDFQC